MKETWISSEQAKKFNARWSRRFEREPSETFRRPGSSVRDEGAKKRPVTEGEAARKQLLDAVARGEMVRMTFPPTPVKRSA